MNIAMSLVLSCLLLVGAAPAWSQAEPLRVFATTSDLGDLARQVGGKDVVVVEMVKGAEDPHFAQAKPSFIKELSVADVFVQVGLGLEVGYVPLLLANARNADVLLAGKGYVDASRVVVPMNVATGTVDRSMGDVHAGGSPHYLLDPVRAMAVAELIAAKLSELRPQEQQAFQDRLENFRVRMATAMVGEKLAAKYDAFKLATLAERSGLAAFLQQQGDIAALGGWFGAMLPYSGTKVVDDHAMWSYFAARFGLQVVGHMEPKAGIPPTTKHLRDLIELMKQEHVRAVISSPYYDPRHARVVAEATGAQIIELAHQTGSRDGTESYLEMIDYNVRTTVAALAKVDDAGKDRAEVGAQGAQ